MQDDISEVVKSGVCVGCGVCAAMENSPMKMRMDDFGRYIAVDASAEAALTQGNAVCPFSSRAANEDEIGRELFSPHARYDSHLGYHIGLFAGSASNQSLRLSASSGGVARWLLAELLQSGEVDAVVHVVSRDSQSSSGPLFEYKVVKSPDQVLKGSRSAYYPVEMSGVLDFIRSTPGRYAITGVPCFIKALRLLQRSEPVFKERIRFAIGLICGHLKSTFYSQLLGWQLGIHPSKLMGVDFRAKFAGASAKQKGFIAHGGNPLIEKSSFSRDLFGSDYNLGFFQYPACDYCDDVMAETADITVGDAWLPEFIQDGRGTSVVITRNRHLHEILDKNRANGVVHLVDLNISQMVLSQAGAFRQRREGLAYRLAVADKCGRWRPIKRVQPSLSALSRLRKRVHQMRMTLSLRSYHSFRRALEADDLGLFIEEMRPLVAKYWSLYSPTLLARAYKGILRRLSWVFEKLLAFHRH